jgi:hypothetical protein
VILLYNSILFGKMLVEGAILSFGRVGILYGNFILHDNYEY